MTRSGTLCRGTSRCGQVRRSWSGLCRRGVAGEAGFGGSRYGGQGRARPGTDWLVAVGFGGLREEALIQERFLNLLHTRGRCPRNWRSHHGKSKRYFGSD